MTTLTPLTPTRAAGTQAANPQAADTPITSPAPTLDLDALSAGLDGALLRPGTPEYGAEVAGFNLSFQPQPLAVVAARHAGDVAAAVAFAAGHGLQVSVQATGHGLTSDLADTLLVSTRALTGVTVDPAASTARVGAGTRWREVIDAAAPYGLAPLSGSSSNVGVVGYTLGGGMGVLARKYGFAADHVRSLTVVTGDGEIRTVDAEADPDLFWALRGAKAGFGVVTEIEIGLVPVARFHGGGLFFPGTSASTILHAWRSWSADLPREVTTSVALLHLPPDPQLPPPLQGQFVVHLRYVHQGSEAEAEELLAPMRAVAPVLLDAVSELPYAAVDAVHCDPTSPMPAAEGGTALTALPAEAVDALLDEATAPGSALVMVEVRLLGGALADAPAVPNAVTGRTGAYSLLAIGVLAGPAAGAVRGQIDAVLAAVAPWRAPGLLNFTGQASLEERRGLWSAEDRGRLHRVATARDSAGVFGGDRLYG